MGRPWSSSVGVFPHDRTTRSSTAADQPSVVRRRRALPSLLECRKIALGRPPMTDLFRLSARDAAQRIAAGSLTAEALIRACLDRIAAREPEVGAWAYVDPDQARTLPAWRWRATRARWCWARP